MKSLAGAEIAFYCYAAQTIAAGLLKSNLNGRPIFPKMELLDSYLGSPAYFSTIASPVR